MDRPTVTAIITTFNRRPFLTKAVQSVLNQTFFDFELLILDNSSSDGTEDAIKGFPDSRVRYIRHPPLTIAQQRNLGLKEAKGAFIAFLDDDDEWLPIKLEKQLGAFKKGSVDIGLVYGGFTRINSDGKEYETHHPKLKGNVLTELLWQADAFTGSASNPMMRAAVLQALGGYNDSISASEDWELYLRLAERYQVDYVPDIVVKIRSHRGPRLGDRISEALMVEEMVLDRYRPIMDSRLKSFYLQKIGGKLCRVGSLDEGRRRIREAIKMNPLNVLAYLQHSFSFLGSGLYSRIHRWYKQIF